MLSDIDYNRESKRVELIRKRINDDAYLNAAIQRLALVLSNELIVINASKMQHANDAKGRQDESKRKKRV